MSNTEWSTYVQTSEELYLSRELRFHDGNKAEWLRALRAKDGMRILEVGCGPGLFCHRLQSCLPMSQVTGLDRDTGHLAYARSKAKELGLDCAFVEGDAMALPFPDGSFDLCFSHTVFDFCDPKLFLREQHRVLASGGVVVLSTVAGGVNTESWKPGPMDEEKALFDRLWAEARKSGHYELNRNGVGVEEYPRYLMEAGFRSIHIDTLSAVLYAPDDAETTEALAARQIEESRLSELSSVRKARRMAPDALTAQEYDLLEERIERRHDRRITRYRRGEPVWDFSASLYVQVSGIK